MKRIGSNENQNENEKRRVLTTYLDNDDALNVRFVEDLQKRALIAKDGTFFYYDNGYQYYTEDKFLLQINYPCNHFVSVVEGGNPSEVKGIFGYGRHYYLDKIEGAAIEHIKTDPMWCEVVHEKNILNDANFFWCAKLAKKADGFMFQDSQDSQVRMSDQRSSAGFGYGLDVYLFKFMPRYIKTFVKRTKNKLFGRKW